MQHTEETGKTVIRRASMVAVAEGTHSASVPSFVHTHSAMYTSLTHLHKASDWGGVMVEKGKVGTQ